MQSVNPCMARWSRNGNLLCHGHWIISWMDKPVNLPESRREKDMGTWAIYSVIDPDDETFAQGLEEDAWIIENVDWLTDLFYAHDIALETENYRYFYQAVNKQDWRCTSCAGCM